MSAADRPKPKKLSQAEFRRLAATPPVRTVRTLGPGVADFLEQYRPERIDDDVWGRTRPAFLAAMSMCGAGSVVSAQKLAAPVASFLAWRARQGLRNIDTTAFTYPDIDAWVKAMAHQPGTLNDYAERLRSLAREVNPERCPAKWESLPRNRVRPAYTPDEVHAIVTAITGQRSPTICRQLCAIAGLGLGAGLDSPDLRHLMSGHITDDGDAGIRVSVPGSRPRAVMVRRTYEPLVRTGVRGLRPGELVLGRDATRRNIVAAIVEKAEIADPRVPRIEAARLRSTWLLWAVQQPIPLTTLLSAAGLTSGHTLYDLVATLDRTDPQPGALR